MTDRPTCKTCRFWRARECGGMEPFEGFCTARPPVLLPGFTRGQWPLTGPSEGCGEHCPPLPAPSTGGSLLPPSKPSKNACTCPRSPGIHEHVEGYCL